MEEEVNIESTELESITSQSQPDIKDEAQPTAVNDSQTPAEDTSDTESAETSEDTLEGLTRDKIVELLVVEGQKAPEQIDANAVARLKQHFYMLHNEFIHEARDRFIAEGGAEEMFEVPTDECEAPLKEALAVIRDKKALLRAEKEKQMEQAYQAKRRIVEALSALSSDASDANLLFPRAKELREQFFAAGEVAQEKATEIAHAFKEAEERFYDQLKINKELRDYDFRKNLTIKQEIIAAAEALQNDPDVVGAYRRMQDLFARWRDTGPVAKELREEISTRFGELRSAIHRRHQEFFEARKSQDEEIDRKKQEIIDTVRAIDYSGADSIAAWDALTRQFLEAQEQWKAAGVGARKHHMQLYAEFREVCDAFFAAKSAFFKEKREDLAANLARKTALCEEAESLRDSEDLRKTADRLVELQKQWKTIGQVPRRNSDAVWKRFTAACDAFFDRKKTVEGQRRNDERENLKAKRSIIEQLRALAADTKADVAAQADKLREQWRAIGHVPFRDKERLQEEYRVAMKSLSERIAGAERRRPMASDEELKTMDSNQLSRERERIARLRDQRRSELQTYENNLGFFNSKSKSGETMLRDLQKKTEALRKEIAELDSRLRSIDAKA